MRPPTNPVAPVTATITDTDQFDPNTGNNSASATETPQRADLVITNALIIDGAELYVTASIGIAMVPEGRKLFPSLSVEENLLMGTLSRRAGAWDLARVYDLFPILKEKRRQPGTSLSGGQQQMVAIAQALMVEPRFLVIDELSFGLAPTIVARLVPIIRRIADSGIGVLLIEQFTQLALALAHHVYVMSRGTVSYDGEPGKLRDDPEILHRAYFPVSSKEAVGL